MNENEHDVELWCDETLPELYDEGMFDYEEISEDIWEAVAAAMEPVLDVFEEEEDREEMADALTEAAREWFRLHHETVLESTINRRRPNIRQNGTISADIVSPPPNSIRFWMVVVEPSFVRN